MVDKNKAVVCGLLATSEKKGKESVKCEMMVSAGKLKKLWDSLSELRSSLCERQLESTILRPAQLLVKTAQFA